MDDDGGDWFAAADDEPAPAAAAPAPAAGGAAAAPAGAEPAGGETKPVDEPKPEAEAEYLDPDKLLLCKHWIRPKFLQYNYLYDYRLNYYDDVIDYLDKRQHGFIRDIPRAQTWAERALRTYNSRLGKAKYMYDCHHDTKLCTNIRLSSRFHIYHSKEYFNRRYSSLM
ncbi:flightin [Onthophagus taurus]|uniref:flightin n=1 Tax=Onthophagus taurus TaxID=166361 RepID=UPI000C201191|nr:flightin [Onthophagus taurus]